MNFRFIRMFTGKQGDFPVLTARFNNESGPTVDWEVRSDFTGWVCTRDGNDGCDHSDAVEGVIPPRLVKFLDYLEQRADAGKIKPQKRRRR